MNNLENSVRLIINEHLPEYNVVKVKNRGIWERHIIEVVLDNNKRIFIKIQLTDWNMTSFEVTAVQLFEKYNLPTPKIIAVDTSCKIISHPFLIQEWRGGTRLSELIEKSDNSEVKQIYKTLGCFYYKLHSIHNDKSGLLVPFPNAPSPNDYMYQAEIINGSGRRAFELGKITKITYDKIIKVWEKNIDYLKSHQPSLINTSPFLWNIYLESNGNEWLLSKIVPMAEFMWWDPAFNLAFLQYPPFGQYNPSYWDAFLQGYTLNIEKKRILLYLLMQRLCASMGIYKEPKSIYYQEWVKHCLDDIEIILMQIE